MAGVGGGSPGPTLTRIEAPGRGPSGQVAFGLITAALVGFVGISLIAQSDGGPGSQAAGVGRTAAPDASPTAAPVATPSPTAPPESPRGTPPPRVDVAVGPVPTCPPGSTPDKPGPADQARPPQNPPTVMAFDRRAGRLVALAGDVGMETWTFDVCTNTWTRMHPDQEPPPGTGGLVYDVDSDVTVALDGSARVWAYDLQANAWTEKGSAPALDPRFELRFYEPVSGRVVATRVLGAWGTPVGVELWSYAVETDTWTPIYQANRLAFEPREYAYDASVDRIVAYQDAGGQPGGARTWLFDLRTGIWSESSGVTPEFGYGWFGTQPAVAYDEVAERTVIVGQGRSVAYDAAADRWETPYLTPSGDQAGACDASGTRPECRDGRPMVYDPVNQRLVVYGGTWNTGCAWQTPDDMWALDNATRSWTLVVPPTPVPPPLRDLTAGGAPASTGPDRSPWIRAAKVMLHGGSFFTRVAGVADEPWSSTPPVAPATVADGLFLPECQLWTDGTVWWEGTTSDPSSRAWIEIDLGGTFALDAAVVQADVNDDYRLSYRDPKTGKWAPLWEVPHGEAGGLATRPHQGDASVRWPLARKVVTDALRFEATSGDAQYSVSEVAVFGQPAP
jgi:hypothetical protein